ncbi:DNA alkylation repair protein [Alloscardovia omnicolens]|uniref:DNA alkylation repair protein n=1 Tax=Alloscardovia omnicolens TaxID=419015 RepID=UPI003A63D272
MLHQPQPHRILSPILRLAEPSYAAFEYRHNPSLDPDVFIGIRTPLLRQLSAQISQADARAFMQDLPHAYFEENQLHAFLICRIKNFDDCLTALDAFLPYVDNWATCDSLTPRVFKKHHAELLPHIERWMNDVEPFIIRFGIGMLMHHFLDEDFDPTYPIRVSRVECDAYYVRMMVAWYFATGLAKQYNAFLPLMEHPILPKWTHNKSIQKAIESYRVCDDHKKVLRQLRIK